VIEVPSAAVDLAKRFEGFHRVPKHDPQRLAHPYICPAGYWTIGYGHLCKPDHPPITEDESEIYMAQDLRTALAATLRYCPVLATEPEGRLAAIVDFTFNLGAGALESSTLLKKLNAGDYAGAQAEFGKWVHAGGEVLPGLVRRRAAEAELFDSSAPAGGSVPAAPADGAGAPDHRANTADDVTVARGDTLSDIARRHGVSLQSLIAANPQLADPNLIVPGEGVHLPAGAAGGAAPVAPSAPLDAAAGDAAAIARRFVGRNASELKGSGELPMDPSVPSNLCCANFVSAVLQQAGLLSAAEHTNSVDRLDDLLRSQGWQPVDPAQARPGDVVIIQGGGVSHTVMVESNDNGNLRLVRSNNVNADGTQRVTIGSADYALSHGAVILTPPEH
jgi:lysozyme